MRKSKTSGIWQGGNRRAKRSEIWDSWTLIEHIWHIFDLTEFNAIFGVNRCAYDFSEKQKPFSKQCFFCTSDSFSTNLLQIFLFDSLYKLSFGMKFRMKKKMKIEIVANRKMTNCKYLGNG